MNVIIWGGTGQCKVVRPIIEYGGHQVVAVFDNSPKLPTPFSDIPIYSDSFFEEWRSGQSDVGFVIAIGNPYGKTRVALQEYLTMMGCFPVSVFHPTAFVEKNVVIGVGCQILAGANVLTECVLGDQVIVNTNVSVDHECILEDGSEVAPGATLCGNVKMGKYATVYAGATVLPRITIGEGSVVGAGAVVKKDVFPYTTVVGVPARRIR